MSIFVVGVIPDLHCQTSLRVTYNISEIKLHGSINDLDEKGKLLTEKVIDYAKEVNYTLIANNNNSLFELEKRMVKEPDSPLDNMLFMMAEKFPSFNKSVYTNAKDKTIVFVRNMVDKDFVVKRNYFDFHWQLKKEFKKILGIDVQKAEGRYLDPVTSKELKVEAWFIPSIPLQFGPDIFIGLPGLVAEVHLKGAVVSMINFKEERDLKIEKIEDTNAMNQQEYESLRKELKIKYIDDPD